MYQNILQIIQAIVAILLIVVVLMQNKGGGMGAVFGGGSDEIAQTKRGAEKLLFNLTIVLAVMFLATALLQFVI